MASNQSILRRFLGAQINYKSALAQAIWELISDKSPEEQIELLTIVLKERDLVSKHEDELKTIGITDDEWDTLGDTQSDFIAAYLKNAFFKARTAEDFSKEILRLINFYLTANEKIYCLAYCIYSIYIPFHELPGEAIRINNETWNRLLRSNSQTTDLIDYLINLPFSSYTEEISHILHIIDSVEKIELRASLLGYYVAKKENILKNKYKDK